jgi:hypothetical protein
MKRICKHYLSMDENFITILCPNDFMEGKKEEGDRR